MMITGKTVGLRQAERIGLVNAIFPQDLVVEKVREYCQPLLHGPTQATGYTKLAAIQGVEMLLEAGLAYERECQNRHFATPDAMGGLHVWQERRKHDFTGQYSCGIWHGGGQLRLSADAARHPLPRHGEEDGRRGAAWSYPRFRVERCSIGHAPVPHTPRSSSCIDESAGGAVEREHLSAAPSASSRDCSGNVWCATLYRAEYLSPSGEWG